MSDVGVNGVSSVGRAGDRSTTFASFHGDRINNRNRGLVVVCDVEAGSEVGEDFIVELLLLCAEVRLQNVVGGHNGDFGLECGLWWATWPEASGLA
jgi:hypothetical protein